MEEKTKKIISFFLALSFLVIAPGSARAATLGIGPGTITKKVGESFTVTAYLSSTDQAANAASGTISFPADKLQVTSVSKAGSVMNLWVADPTFSNADGWVKFEAIALNPGFKGSGGAILSIGFTTKAAGKATISYSGGSVLANDGLGTGILTGKGGATVNIEEKVAPVEPPVTPVPAPTPEKPAEPAVPVEPGGIAITSVSHPDQTKWYGNNTPEFSWHLPADAIEVRTLIGQLAEATPSVRYQPPIDHKIVEALPEGTFYFSLQVRTPKGWGAVTRYQVHIDTIAPEKFDIIIPSTSTEANPSIAFVATDSGSGIDHYEVQFGADAPIVVPANATGPLSIPVRSGGYDVHVTAVDGAGNTTNATTHIAMKEISAPTITYKQDAIEFGDLMKVGGKAAPDSDVYVLVRENGELISREYGHTDSLGNYVVVGAKRLHPGTYTLTAISVEGEAHGAESASVTLVVHSGPVSVSVDWIKESLFLLGALSFGYMLLRVFSRIVELLAQRTIQRPATHARKLHTRGGKRAS